MAVLALWPGSQGKWGQLSTLLFGKCQDSQESQLMLRPFLTTQAIADFPTSHLPASLMLLSWLGLFPLLLSDHPPFTLQPWELGLVISLLQLCPKMDP